MQLRYWQHEIERLGGSKYEVLKVNNEKRGRLAQANSFMEQVASLGEQEENSHGSVIYGFLSDAWGEGSRAGRQAKV